MALAPPADVLTRTPLYRMVHIDCLPTFLTRGALHAPSCVPADGLPYRAIHAAGVQADRGGRPAPCGPRGTIRDYIGFYFGPRSPMLYRIHTGWNVERVPQEDIVYLVAFAQTVARAGVGYIFTDRHSLAAVAAFYDRLEDLHRIDFAAAYAEQWNSTPEHPDRQEKKQAEFLVYQRAPLGLVAGIAAASDAVAGRVSAILAGAPAAAHLVVRVRPNWYY